METKAIDIVTLFRKAVLPEDEGRDLVVQRQLTRLEAESWIKDQEGEYFHPKDYYIVV